MSWKDSKDKAKQGIESIIQENRQIKQSGIYLYARKDEYDIVWFYIGQAVNIYERQISHFNGYDSRLDNSIRKRKFYSADNPYGWKFQVLEYCKKDELNEKETFWILKLMRLGWQTYNSTYGSQGQGKTATKEYKEPKGYNKGVAYGKAKQLDEIKVFFEKYLDFVPKNQNKVTLRKFEEFKTLIGENNAEKDKN